MSEPNLSFRQTLIAGALGGLMVAGPTAWSAWLQADTQVELARRTERYAARERRKQEVKSFVEYCFELSLVGHKLGLVWGDDDEQRAAFGEWRRASMKFDVVRTGVLAEYPHLADGVRMIPQEKPESSAEVDMFEFMGPVQDQKEYSYLVGYQLVAEALDQRRNCRHMGELLVQGSVLQDEKEARRAGD